MKRHTMKTALSLLLVTLLLVLPLAGCGGAGRGEADLHVFYYTFSDTYISTVRSALDQKLGDAGIRYQDYDGNGNQTIQTEQIRTAITKGAKAILVNIVNTGSNDAANEIVGLARDAGIPVVFFNREVADEVIKSYERCAFVGTRAEEAGILQGEMIGEYLVANYNALDLNRDGVISYILFKGEEGNNEAIFRTKYSVEKANEYLTANGKKPLRFYDASNANGYLVDRNGQWSAAAANEYMTTALSTHNTASNNMIELVICNNDGMAEGAISALNAAGFNNGGSSTMIPVFGVDATDAAINLIGAKKMAGTVKQDAVGMAEALALLSQNAAAGADLMANTASLSVDKDVNKIRIAYAKYLG